MTDGTGTPFLAFHTNFFYWKAHILVGSWVVVDWLSGRWLGGGRSGRTSDDAQCLAKTQKNQQQRKNRQNVRFPVTNETPEDSLSIWLCK